MSNFEFCSLQLIRCLALTNVEVSQHTVHHNMQQCGNFPAARFQGKLCHSWFWKKLLSKQSHLVAHILPRVKTSQPKWNTTHSSLLPQPCRCHGNIRVVLERLHPFLDKRTHCCKINVLLFLLKNCAAVIGCLCQTHASFFPHRLRFSKRLVCTIARCGIWHRVMFMLRALYWTHRFNLSKLSLRKAIASVLRWCHTVGD